MKNKFSIRSIIASFALAWAATSVQAQEESAKEIPRAQPTTKESPKTADPAKGTPKVRPLSVTVDLASKTAINGTLTEASNFDVRTSFGSASIPLSEVAGIRFASADDPTTTVIMLNGDSLTGASETKLMTVETEWGVATINGQSISSILFVPSLIWKSEDGLNGKRWALVNEKSKAPEPTPVPQPRPGTPVPAGNQFPNGGFNPSPIIRNQ